MTQAMKHLMDQYIIEVQKIYGTHLKRVILYLSLIHISEPTRP